VKRPLAYALGVTAALASGWAGARLYGAWVGPARADHATATTTATAGVAPLAAAGEEPAAPDPEQVPLIHIPASLPPFTLADAAGKPTPITAWRGQSLVLNFWATWCAPCRREIPLLETLAAEWHPHGVAVVGVAVDHRAEVIAFAQQYHIAYPLLIGEQDALDAAAALGVDSPVFPFTVFTDRQGDIVAVFVGELHRPQADLILSVVAKLNDAHIELAAARRAITDGLEQIKQGAAARPAGG
jgi:thiol-disulfide isomerase/thioredoxin